MSIERRLVEAHAEHAAAAATVRRLEVELAAASYSSGYEAGYAAAMAAQARLSSAEADRVAAELLVQT